MCKYSYMEESNIILYQTEDGQTQIEVRLENDTVWLTANQMSLLFDRDEKTIRKHINNVFSEGELWEKTIRIFCVLLGFCAVRTSAVIAAQDFILTPGRYVGIAEAADDGEPFEAKMERLTSELTELFAKDHLLQNEIRDQLGKIGFIIY